MMFDLLRFICENIFGSSLSLSHESFDYLSSKLHIILIEIIQQSFSITLKSKRTHLLGDDLQLILKSRSISPLFGYCCSSTTDIIPLFKTVRQDARTLFVQNDILIENNLFKKNNLYRDKISSLSNKIFKKFLHSSDDIIIHIEWIAINGEQKYNSQIKSSLFNKSILNIEQKLYLSFIQSKTFNNEISNFLSSNPISLNIILPYLIQWCRNNICECLLHSCRLEKRRQLAYYLTIINYLLENSSIINLHILSPIITTCLFYEFEINESLDFDDNNENSIVDTGHIWSIRLLAARICVQILKHSNILIYDVFYIRIMSRLIYSLIDLNTSSSIIYAILCLFEQLDVHVCRTFLLPHLFDLNWSKILSSKSIIKVFERISMMLIQ